MTAPMECECMLTRCCISNAIDSHTVLEEGVLVSLCHRNMLSIDCDHDPVNGLLMSVKHSMIFGPN